MNTGVDKWKGKWKNTWMNGRAKRNQGTNEIMNWNLDTKGDWWKKVLMNGWKKESNEWFTKEKV